MSLDVIFSRGHLLNPDKALTGLLEPTLLNQDDAEVVMTLDVSRIDLNDLLVAVLRGLQVLDMVGVDVAHQDETL